MEIALRRSRPASSAGLAAPPLYAAGVSAPEPRSLSESLDQALELANPKGIEPRRNPRSPHGRGAQ